MGGKECHGGGGKVAPGVIRRRLVSPQSTQSAGPVRFLIFYSISMFLLASLVAGRRSQCSEGAE